MVLRVVIIGAGHAGGRVAQALSRQDAGLKVTLLGREPHPPYERPPLSKGVLLGTAGRERCLIWPPGDPAWSRVRFRPDVAATDVDIGRKLVTLSDGGWEPYDKLVLATGSRLRPMPVPGCDRVGVHALRTLDESVALSDRFREGRRLLVVGGGFVGLEVAAAAASRGLATRVVEASDRLLSRMVPTSVAETLADRHRAAGVAFRFGDMVERFVGGRGGAVKGARLSSGETVPCDLAVVGVGVAPDADLAERAGLAVDVGIRTDETLATSDPDVYACGDVASFWHPAFRRHVRVEAWHNAEDHARIVTAAILGRDVPPPAIPFFWSDQYELSLQIVGLPHLAASSEPRNAPTGSSLTFHHDATGRIVGATALGPAEAIGREVRRARALIATAADPAPDLAMQRGREFISAASA